VDAFWTDARNIFETASQAARAGWQDCDLAILIDPQGAIHMMDAGGWSLPSLAADRGAQAAYRVTRQSGRVQVEGRAGSRTCLLAGEFPGETARRLLAGPLPFYHEAPTGFRRLAQPVREYPFMRGMYEQ